MAKELTTYEKIEKCLYKSRDEASNVLTSTELEAKERWLLCVTKKMENPLIPDSDLVTALMSGFEGVTDKVSQATAYRDIASVNRLVGNIKLASKNWYRYIIIEGAKKSYKIAEEERDSAGMNGALDKLGKYTRADKEDNEFDWSQMLPPIFEPTDDITILGEEFEPLPPAEMEERRKQLRGLFKGRTIEDTDYTEIPNHARSTRK